MQEYIQDLDTPVKPGISFTAPKAPVQCHPQQAVALFRILQEALVNASKHAQARHVMVELSASAEEVVLTVRDDGKGYDPGGRESTSGGFGVLIMRERMRALGGAFTVESRPGEGTTVRASLPLSAGPSSQHGQAIMATFPSPQGPGRIDTNEPRKKPAH
jgi:signal transduction histidine kinase